MLGFYYTPIDRPPYLPTAEDYLVLTDETVPPTVRPDAFKYAIGDKPVGAFFKGALGYGMEAAANKGGSTTGSGVTTEEPPAEKTFMQKYGLWIGGGIGLAVLVAGGIAAYNAFANKGK